MAMALTIKQVSYILDCDKELPTDEQTIFALKPLSAKEYMVLTDEMDIKDGSIGNIGTYTYEILSKGLVGWSNLLDEEGKQVKFGKDADTNIDRLAVDYRMELTQAISELSTVSKAQVKN